MTRGGIFQRDHFFMLHRLCSARLKASSGLMAEGVPTNNQRGQRSGLNDHLIETDISKEKFQRSIIMRRVWFASKDTDPSGHMAPSLFGTCIRFNCLDHFPQTCRHFLYFFTLNIPRSFLDFAPFSLNLSWLILAKDSKAKSRKFREIFEAHSMKI